MFLKRLKLFYSPPPLVDEGFVGVLDLTHPGLISGQEFYSLMNLALTRVEEILSKSAKTR